MPHTPCSTHLLSADQMQQVDRKAIEQGIDSFWLMKNAGRAVADHVLCVCESISSATIVAGGGNNGADGFVAAEYLKRIGIETKVLCLNAPIKTDTDAHRARNFYSGDPIYLPKGATKVPLHLTKLFRQCDVIVDALFGAGLARDVNGVAANIIELINVSDKPIVAVDLPSGLDGNCNRVKFVAVKATSTVTFFRAKPAHFLYPGKQLCGQLLVKQIGLSEAHLPCAEKLVHKNSVELFKHHLPSHHPTSHKYQRGHVLVRSGPIHSTGAARLSATAALSCGAGAVTLASSETALPVNAAHLTAVMLVKCDNDAEWQEILLSKNINVAVIGPGNRVNAQLKECVIKTLQSPVSAILDADALSCWKDSSDTIVTALQQAKSTAALTPHSGEFERVFQSTSIMSLPSKLHQTIAAAKLTQAVIVHKGADTVIAAPDGRAVINHNAPPWLATAGSGDVLAGALAALHAQGMPLFEAAIASAWLHGQAGVTLGYPLTAEMLASQMGKELGILSKST